jgi:TPP-dependent pyruvate/acetoin dehydrogenase alpha subunit
MDQTLNTAPTPSIGDLLPTIDGRAALCQMMLIRRFEDAAEVCYMRGSIHGTMHLSIGQEASAVGLCLELRRSDLITSTHCGRCGARDQAAAVR